ncbi:MAG: GNAT family N-acetyltransferase [Planctomycetota bacterium]
MTANSEGVRLLAANDEMAWTEYVSGHPEANLYHTLLWRDFIRSVFRHEPFYLAKWHAGKIEGILPMFRVRLPLLGAKLISLPYDIGSGGTLAASSEIEIALVRQAMALANEQGVKFLEIRHGEARLALEELGLQRVSPVIVHDMQLDDREAVWARVRKDHRKQVKRAANRGVTVREADRAEDFESFYRVYLEVFRDFGTPPYAAKYFRRLGEDLHPRKAVRLLIAEAEGVVVGGLMLFAWQRNLVSKFASCLPSAVELRAYAALYARAIDLGLDEGFSYLSWGSSSRDQKGLIEFKARWGSQAHDAAVYDLPVRGRVPSLEGYYDSQALTRRVWRRLPLAATRVLGGMLNRWFC